MSITRRGGDALDHHTWQMGAVTPLEVLFDVTFVIGFGLTASQLAHALSQGHYG